MPWTRRRSRVWTSPGRAVLVHTGWDAHWGTERYLDADHPHLTEDACRALVDGGAVLVGIDSVNIDDTVGGGRPAHTVLLGAGIPVVEHLTGLGGLPDSGAVFTRRPGRGRRPGDLPRAGLRDRRADPPSGQRVRRSSAMNMASVPCRCGQSWP